MPTLRASNLFWARHHSFIRTTKSSSMTRLCYLWTGFLCLLFSLFATAQNTPFEATFYYNTAEYSIAQTDSILLVRLINYANKYPDKQVVIQGHTDDQGTIVSNSTLSRSRANAVKKELIQAGISADRLHTKGFGEAHPLYASTTDEARGLNRRVEIFVVQEVLDIHWTQVVKNRRLMEQIRPESIRFHLPAGHGDTSLRTPSGTRLELSSNSFEMAEGQEVVITIQEAYTISDMLLNGLATTSSQGLLTTGGMFKIEATLNGQLIALKNDKLMTIKVPTDTIAIEMQLYDSDSILGHGLDWVNPKPLKVFEETNNSFDQLYPGLEDFLDSSNFQLDSFPLQFETAAQQQQYEADRARTDLLQARYDSLNKALGQVAASSGSPRSCGCNKRFSCWVKQVFEPKRTKRKRLICEEGNSALLKQNELNSVTKAELSAALQALRIDLQASSLKTNVSYEQYKVLLDSTRQFIATRERLRRLLYRAQVQRKQPIPSRLVNLVKQEHHFVNKYAAQQWDSLEIAYGAQEGLFCGYTFDVKTYQEAIREDQYNQYLEAGNFDALKKDYPEREKEISEVLYGVSSFEEVEAIREGQRLTKQLFYELQSSGEFFGRWMNLDYLSKLPPKDLLVQRFYVPEERLARADFLVYRNTKAIGRPARKEATSMYYSSVVRDRSHTIISYYALNDKEVAFATQKFVGKKGYSSRLAYKTLSIDEFAKCLKQLN